MYGGEGRRRKGEKGTPKVVCEHTRADGGGEKEEKSEKALKKRRDKKWQKPLSAIRAAFHTSSNLHRRKSGYFGADCTPQRQASASYAIRESPPQFRNTSTEKKRPLCAKLAKLHPRATLIRSRHRNGRTGKTILATRRFQPLRFFTFPRGFGGRREESPQKGASGGKMSGPRNRARKQRRTESATSNTDSRVDIERPAGCGEVGGGAKRGGLMLLTPLFYLLLLLLFLLSL